MPLKCFTFKKFRVHLQNSHSTLRNIFFKLPLHVAVKCSTEIKHSKSRKIIFRTIKQFGSKKSKS